MKSKSIRRN